MANNQKRNKLSTKQKALSSLIVLILLFVGAMAANEKMKLAILPTWNQLFEVAGLKEAPVSQYDGLTVTYLDVGQGDCVILSVGDFNAMIDGGEAENADKIIAYLSQHNIKKLDYMFVSHPHNDHMGALAAVMKVVPTTNLVAPKIPQLLIPTTTAYEAYLNAINDNHVKAVFAKVGNTYAVGEGKISILAPITDAKDLNNQSMILRLDYGNRSFMFQGDAEASEEKILLSSSSFLDIDVMKAGHHGSRTSGSDNFLTALSPQYSIISCGRNNQFEHPHPELIQRYFNHQITYYRTDQCGTITCTTDGNVLNFSFEKEMNERIAS